MGRALEIDRRDRVRRKGDGWPSVLPAVSSALESIVAGPLRRSTAKRCVGLAALAREAGQSSTAADLAHLALGIAGALGDEALLDAARAEQRQEAAASAAGAQTLASCRSMFRATGPAVPLAAVPWLGRRYGERPPAPPPQAATRGLNVGPLNLLDLTAKGHGWSVFQDLSALLGTKTNYEAEERIRSVIAREDPILAKSLVYDTEADHVSILAKTRDDILAVAAWILSIG